MTKQQKMTEVDIDPETGEVSPAVDDAEIADGDDDAPDFNPELGTLMGDMRDAMLMRIRTLQKPWPQMSEQEQTDCANGIELADMLTKHRSVVLNVGAADLGFDTFLALDLHFAQRDHGMGPVEAVQQAYSLTNHISGGQFDPVGAVGLLLL